MQVDPHALDIDQGAAFENGQRSTVEHHVERSAVAAKADKEWDDQMHGQDYLVYAYLQLGEDQKARAVVDEMSTTAGYKRFAGFYAFAASAARFPVERSDWKSASDLALRPSQFAYADAVTHFARALGLARSGNAQAAGAEVVKLAELRDKLREAKDAYWTDVVDIQRQVAAAWVLYAEGKYGDALAAMRAATAAEDKTEKHPVTPGPLAPARELYGAMLLERSQFQEALAAFEATMVKEPNRYNAIAGAARSAELLGDKAMARTYYGQLVTLAGGSGSERPALVQARQFLAAN